jgi:3alpha(or 20beta)-hydroxysteroid dehydrogenase
VTGFTGSIGSAVKAALEHAGAEVLGLNHTRDPDAFAVLDFSDDAAVKTVVSRAGPLSAVVLCHGIAEASPVRELSPARFRELIEVNLNSSYAIIQAAIPRLSRGGSIVVISSTAGLGRSRKAGVHYTVSKWALNGLVKHLAAELGPDGIRVNAVLPGHIDNEMSRSMSPDEPVDASIAAIPLRRAGTPEDVASAVLFLLGDDADYLTGVLLPVAGGTH